MQNLESMNFKCVQKLNGLAVILNEGVEIPFRLIHTTGQQQRNKGVFHLAL